MDNEDCAGLKLPTPNIYFHREVTFSVDETTVQDSSPMLRYEVASSSNAYVQMLLSCVHNLSPLPPFLPLPHFSFASASFHFVSFSLFPSLILLLQLGSFVY